MPSEMNARCVVYVIGEEDGPYKVGIGHNPDKRIFAIQAGNPRTLRLYRVWDVKPWAVQVEAGAHRLLKEHHIHSEWFSADLATCIQAVEISARRVADQVERDTGVRPFDVEEAGS